jgi:hypothetical protein
MQCGTRLQAYVGSAGRRASRRRRSPAGRPCTPSRRPTILAGERHSRHCGTSGTPALMGRAIRAERTAREEGEGVCYLHIAGRPVAVLQSWPMQQTARTSAWMRAGASCAGHRMGTSHWPWTHPAGAASSSTAHQSAGGCGGGGGGRIDERIDDRVHNRSLLLAAAAGLLGCWPRRATIISRLSAHRYNRRRQRVEARSISRTQRQRQRPQLEESENRSIVDNPHAARVRRSKRFV